MQRGGGVIFAAMIEHNVLNRRKHLVWCRALVELVVEHLTENLHELAHLAGARFLHAAIKRAEGVERTVHRHQQDAEIDEDRDRQRNEIARAKAACRHGRFGVAPLGNGALAGLTQRLRGRRDFELKQSVDACRQPPERFDHGGGAFNRVDPRRVKLR